MKLNNINKFIQQNGSKVNSEEFINDLIEQNGYISKFQLHCLFQQPHKNNHLIPYTKSKSGNKSLKTLLNINKQANNAPKKENSKFINNLFLIQNQINQKNKTNDSSEKVVRFSSNIESSEIELIPLKKEMFQIENAFIKYNKRKDLLGKISQKAILKKEENQIVVLLEEIIDEIIRYSEWFVSEKYREHFFSKLINIVKILINNNSSDIIEKYEKQIREKIKKRLENETGNQWEKIWDSCEAKIQADSFEKYWDKEIAEYEAQINKIEELRKEARGIKGFRKSNTVIQNQNEILKHYQIHSKFFELVKSSMKISSKENVKFKELESQLFKFSSTLQVSENSSNRIMEIYNEMWDIIFQYFSSRIFLKDITTSAIAFIKEDPIRNANTMNNLFIKNHIRIELEFYDILIHLIYKSIIRNKGINMFYLHRLVKIQRIFKEKFSNKFKKISSLDKT